MHDEELEDGDLAFALTVWEADCILCNSSLVTDHSKLCRGNMDKTYKLLGNFHNYL